MRPSVLFCKGGVETGSEGRDVDHQGANKEGKYPTIDRNPKPLVKYRVLIHFNIHLCISVTSQIGGRLMMTKLEKPNVEN
jgi:hypothetical protein